MESVCGLAEVAGKGRGVVAHRAIAKGEVVERSPVLVLPVEQVDTLCQTLLDEYVFVWGRERETVAVAFGLGSLFNHSYHPNLRYDRDLDNATLVFTALESIEAGAELTVNYNGDPACLDPVWFDLA